MKLLGRLYDAIITGLAWVAGLILVMIFLFVMQDVILRNMLISPPRWSAPMAEYGLLYITLLAAPWLVRTRGHVTLEVVRRRLSVAAARRLEITVYLTCIAICGVMGWLAAELWIEAFVSGEEDHRAIEIPRTWLFAPALIAFPLMGCEFLRFLIGRGSLYAGGAMGGDGV
jgi:TRAP-type C4-dicarboxylate transport system permease small subunit